ncbi:MAG: hypothetical protein AAB604_03200 [Patescibacteria group bacterium]
MKRHVFECLTFFAAFIFLFTPSYSVGSTEEELLITEIKSTLTLLDEEAAYLRQKASRPRSLEKGRTIQIWLNAYWQDAKSIRDALAYLNDDREAMQRRSSDLDEMQGRLCFYREKFKKLKEE